MKDEELKELVEKHDGIQTRIQDLTVEQMRLDSHIITVLIENKMNDYISINWTRLRKRMR